MAKNKVTVDVTVDDKGSLKQVGKRAKAAAAGVDQVGQAAHTADRNMKGASQQSSNTTKNFSKMAQGMGGLVAVYATLAAQVFAVTAAYQFLSTAVDFKNLIEGQKALGAVTGVAYKTISNSIIEATNGQLKYADAAKAAAIGTAGGISPSQLERLGVAAKNASIALGRDLGDSFDRLIRGVTKAEPEVLDELGIILRLEAATEKYAVTIGKTRNELNAYERSQAVANEVLDQAERKFGAMEKLMDPNAVALNQFGKAFNDIVNSLREMLAGPVSQLASFLSQNLYALLGVLSLFSVGVLKQLLPSMEDWKKSIVASKDANTLAQQSIRAEITKTRLEYDALKDAELQAALAAGKKSGKVLKNMEGSPTGQGAVDFLKNPDVTSKKAMSAADKALSNAQKQLNEQAINSAVKRTGILKDLNRQEVADLRAAYEAKKAIIDRGAKDFNKSTVKMRMSWALFRVNFRAGITSMKAGFASLAGFAATAGAIISKAFFWLSIISISISALKAAWDWIYPASEASKKLEKETQALTEKYQTLSEEVGRTVEALNTTGLLTATEKIQAIGNAITSIEVPKLVEDINRLSELDPSSKGYKNLKKELSAITEELIAIEPGFKGINKYLKEGIPIGLSSAQGFNKLASNLAEAGFNSSQLKDKLQSSDAELQKLIGTFEKPFGVDFLAASNTAIEGLKLEIVSVTEQIQTAIEKQRELLNPPEREGGRRGQGGRSLKQILGFDEEDSESPNKVVRAGRGNKVQDAAGLARIEAIQREKAEAEAAKRAAAAKDVEDPKALQSELIERLGFEEKLSAEILRATTDVNALRLEALATTERAEELRTQGRNTEEKLANLTADELVRQIKVNKLKEAQLLLEARITAVNASKKPDEELSKTMQETLKIATDQKDQADAALRILEDQLGLESQRTGTLRVAVTLEGELLRISAERLGITTRIANEELRLKNIQAGGTGSFGFGRVKEASGAQENILKGKIQEAENARKSAQASLFDVDLNNSSDVDRVTSQYAQAQTGLDAARQELDTYQKRGQEAVLAARGETEYAQARLQTLSLNPIEQQFQERLLELKKAGIPTTEEQEKALRAETEAQWFLNEAYETKAALFDSLASNMTSAFTALIDGTKTAKQAFADMAVSILTDIAQMIAKMLVMRLLMSAFGGTSFGNFLGIPAPGARYGGVMEPPSRRYGGVTQPPPGYARGGIARGSDAGYPAILHGTEAVVPLPNNRSIPVDLKGAGQQNNVTVNVSVANDGKASQDTQASSNQGANLGAAIASAVQKELQNQKRSGGILNPYGVA